MQAQSGPISVSTLRRLWRRWTSVVESYALQLPRRSGVDPWTYRSLHHDLVQACVALAAASRNSKRTFYEDLRDLAQPWLTTWILQQSDREILLDLLQRCEKAERKLGGIARFRALFRPLAAGTAFLASAIISALVVWFTQPMWASATDRLDDNWRLFILGVKRFSALEWMLLIGGIGIVLAMLAVSRTGWRR